MLRRTCGFLRATLPALAALPLALALWVAAAGAQQPGAGQDQAGTPFRPVAVVNGSAITGFDLIQRAQIMQALGFQAPGEEALRSAALERLIEDRLKMLEADRLGLSVTRDEVDAGVANLARNLGVAPEELLAELAAQGVSRQAVDELVAAEALWRKVVSTRFAGRIDLGDEQVDAEVAALAGRNTMGYRLAEIGLQLETAQRSAEETRALARRLASELAAGGDFAAAARRHSEASSAPQGGEVGWVTADGLPPEVAEAVTGLEAGDVTAPIALQGGVSILKVLEKRAQPLGQLDREDPELRERVRNQLAAQQGERLADGLMQELRRDALIEVR